jgi:hypothetical protein
VNVAVPLSPVVLWIRAYGGQPFDVPAHPEFPTNAASPGRPAAFGDVTATFADATRAPDRQRILVPA